MAKEPGEVAFYAAGWVTPWDHLDDQTRAQWSAIEAACRASALEEAAKVADRSEWIGCANCGAVLNDWYTYKCKKYDEWIFSEQGKRMILLDGAYHADRYFEKHICGRFDRLEHQKIGPAIAAEIRSLIPRPAAVTQADVENDG